MNEWIDYKTNPPPKRKKMYYCKTSDGRVFYDEYRHRTLKGWGIHLDYGWCFALLSDDDIVAYKPMGKGGENK